MKDTRLSIKALIKKEDTYLFIQESIQGKDVWDIPGGGVEYGETPLEALHREVYEELHVEVTPIKPIGMWWHRGTVKDVYVYCYTFLCEPTGKFEIDFSHNPAQEDIHTAEWFTKEELLSEKFASLPDSLKVILREQLSE